MNSIKKILKNNEGVTVIEIVLILVVLIALVMIFKTQLNSIIRSIFANIRESISAI